MERPGLPVRSLALFRPSKNRRAALAGQRMAKVRTVTRSTAIIAQWSTRSGRRIRSLWRHHEGRARPRLTRPLRRIGPEGFILPPTSFEYARQQRHRQALEQPYLLDKLSETQMVELLSQFDAAYAQSGALNTCCGQLYSRQSQRSHPPYRRGSPPMRFGGQRSEKRLTREGSNLRFVATPAAPSSPPGRHKPQDHVAVVLARARRVMNILRVSVDTRIVRLKRE
jgi:hypothetical protein